MKHNFESFCSKLNKSVVNEINGWSEDQELKKLLSTLKSINDPQPFLDHYAEAMIARFFMKPGYLLNVEFPTINGKHADFRAYKDDSSFFIHIKRLNTEGKIQKQMNIQSRLKDLKKIQKPFVVSILFFRDLSNLEMQYFYDFVYQFIMKASVGDSVEIEKNNGGILGECLIYGTNKVGHVLLVHTSQVKVIEDKKRFYDKLSDAYNQFMPKAVNLIFITSPWTSDIEDFESALLGGTYEDYTVIPTKKGRQNNGFWSGNKHPDSYIAIWFNFGLGEDYINFSIWYRDNYKVPEFIMGIFENKIFKS